MMSDGDVVARLHKADVISVMAAVVGSADSILRWDHDPDDLINVACQIYDRVSVRDSSSRLLDERWDDD